MKNVVVDNKSQITRMIMKRKNDHGDVIKSYVYFYRQPLPKNDFVLLHKNVLTKLPRKKLPGWNFVRKFGDKNFYSQKTTITVESLFRMVNFVEASNSKLEEYLSNFN